MKRISRRMRRRLHGLRCRIWDVDPEPPWLVTSGQGSDDQVSPWASKPQSPPPLRQPVDVVFEDRPDPAQVAHLVASLRPRRLITELPLPCEVDADVHWLPELHAVASPEDEQVRVLADGASAPVIDLAAQEGVHGAVQGDDVHLNALTFEFQDMVYQRLRRAENLVTAIDHDPPASLVFVRRSGTLLRATRAALERRVGPDAVRVVNATAPVLTDRVRWHADKRDLGTSIIEIDWWLRRGLTMAVAGARRFMSEWWTEARDRRGTVLVCVSPSAAHVANLHGVIRELGDRRVVVLPVSLGNASRLDPLIELVDQIPSVSVDWSLARATAAPVVRANQLSRRLLQSLRRVGGPRVTPAGVDVSRCSPSGVALAPLIDQSLVAVMRSRLPGLRRASVVIARILRRRRPCIAVVVPDRGGVARTVIEQCRSQGVPTIFLQALYFTAGARYRPLQADFATLIDTFSRDVMVDGFGVAEERLAITGATTLDLSDPERARQAVPTRQVLLALQPTEPEFNRSLILAVAAAVRASEGGATLVVRPHPRESTLLEERYRVALVDEGFDGVVVDRNADLEEAITQSRVIVSGFSNVLLHAAVLGRAAVSVNLTGQPLPVPFGELGVAREVTDLDDVGKIVRELLVDGPEHTRVRERQEAYMHANEHFRSGSAASRIAAEIRRRELPRPPRRAAAEPGALYRWVPFVGTASVARNR